MDNCYFLVIDQGGHATRATIFDCSHIAIAQITIEIATQRPQPGWVEHDAIELITSINCAIQQVCKQANLPASAKIIAGIASQRSSICCWDKQTSQPHSAVISWQDRRMAKHLPDFNEHDLYQLTGLKLSAHYGASKMQWCLQHIDITPNFIMGPVMGFILSSILQERPLAVDFVNASRTLLFDLIKLNWSSTLLNQADIDQNHLPGAFHCEHQFGLFAVNDHKIPLLLATGDQSAALFAQGEIDFEALYINMGTGAFIQKPTQQAVFTDHNLLISPVHITPTKQLFSLEGTVNGAGSAIQWFIDEFHVDDFFAQIDHWLDSHQTHQGLFLNAVSGIGSPFWQAEFDSEFIQADDITTKAVALIESIIFLIECNIQHMQHIPPVANKIIMSGGLSQNNQICQMLANLSGLSVCRYPDQEATSKGLVFLLHPTGFKQENPMVFSPKLQPALQLRFKNWQKHLQEKIK
jgi:glycerol kinase